MGPAVFIHLYFVVWFAALAALVVWQMLTGRINLGGVLTVDGVRSSPSRLQLLLGTLGGATAYAVACLHAHAFVPVPENLLALYAASHTVHLGHKYMTHKSQ